MVEDCFKDCPIAELGNCRVASSEIPKDCPLKDASQSKSVPSDEEIRIKARDFNKQFLRSYGSFGDMCYQEGAKWMRSQPPNIDLNKLLTKLLSNQEEIISSPIRFNGVHINKIIKIFEDHGIKITNDF